MKATKMFLLLQAMIWANSCSANEITDENKRTLMNRLVKKVQSRSINDTSFALFDQSGRSLVSQNQHRSDTQKCDPIVFHLPWYA